MLDSQPLFLQLDCPPEPRVGFVPAVFFVPEGVAHRYTEDMIELMYNSDFWEVRLNQCELEKMSGEDGLWFESGDDRRLRYVWEDRVAEVTYRILEAVPGCLTEKQREATLLYFCHGKTQREIAEIMGISRRVVSQHLFGITRGGRQVGGAIRKLRKFCEDEGLGFGVRKSASS